MSQEIPTEIIVSLEEESSTGEWSTLWHQHLRYAGSTEDSAVRKPLHAKPPALVEVVEEIWDPKFKKSQRKIELNLKKASDTTKQQLLRDESPAVALTKLGWEILKDGRPSVEANGIFTSALASADMHWERYSEARLFKSKKYRYKHKSLVGITQADVTWSVKGTFGAKYNGTVSEVPLGNYLPTAGIFVHEAHSIYSWKINGSASAMSPSNIGTADHVNPVFILSIGLTASGWFRSESKQFYYTLQGDEGIVE